MLPSGGMAMKRFKVFGLTALLLTIMTGPVAAENLMRIPAYSGDDSFAKPVHTLRDFRFRYVVEQKTDFSCGAAALATLMNYAFNRPVTETQVIDGMMRNADLNIVRQYGFSMLDMKRYLQTQGLRASGFVSQLDKLKSLKIPVITLINSDGFKHFVVLKYYDGNWAYIADPALGNRVLPADQFKKQWSGVLLAVAGPGYKLGNPLIGPSPVLSAKNMINSMQPMQQAQLLEFGFQNSDFF